jgi:hypothetical protein
LKPITIIFDDGKFAVTIQRHPLDEELAGFIWSFVLRGEAITRFTHNYHLSTRLISTRWPRMQVPELDFYDTLPQVGEWIIQWVSKVGIENISFDRWLDLVFVTARSAFMIKDQAKPKVRQN